MNYSPGYILEVSRKVGKFMEGLCSLLPSIKKVLIASR